MRTTLVTFPKTCPVLKTLHLWKTILMFLLGRTITETQTWHISRFKNNNTSIKKLNALKGTNMVWFWKQWKKSPKLYPTNFCPTKWNHQHDWVGIIQSWLKWTHVYIWQQFQTCTSSSCNFNVKVWRCMCYIFGKFSFIFGSQELFLFVRILIPKSKFSYMTCWLEHTT